MTATPDDLPTPIDWHELFDRAVRVQVTANLVIPRSLIDATDPTLGTVLSAVDVVNAMLRAAGISHDGNLSVCRLYKDIDPRTGEIRWVLTQGRDHE